MNLAEGPRRGSPLFAPSRLCVRFPLPDMRLKQMSKFKFRLATLLRIRESVRDDCRAKLAKARRAEDILEEKKRLIEEHLTDMRHRAYQAAAPGEIDVDRLIEARRFETVLLAEKEHAGNQQQMVRLEVERLRQVLVAANREVQVLQKLRDGQIERHRAEENRQEIKTLDEVALERTIAEERS
jgi:flagellar export protein FliJ